MATRLSLGTRIVWQQPVLSVSLHHHLSYLPLTCQGPTLESGGPGRRPVAPGHALPVPPALSSASDPRFRWSWSYSFSVCLRCNQAFHMINPQDENQ